MEIVPLKYTLFFTMGEYDMERPVTTLFMLMSVDGKISTGASDEFDFDKDLAFIDGNRYANTGVKEITIVKGDSKCMSVAAASIIAKVSRDRFMQEVDKQYPQYQFSKHKGYGTKLHYEMIEQYGISPVHRKTFLKNIIGK